MTKSTTATSTTSTTAPSENRGSGRRKSQPGAGSQPAAVIDHAYPVPERAEQLKEALYEWVNANDPQQGAQLREFIEKEIDNTLNEQGAEGIEQLITLYKQIEATKKLREAQVAPFQERVQSFKLLIDEDDQMRRMVQRLVIRWMLNHPDDFRDPNGKLRATTTSFKFSITEKSDRPLILNSSVLEEIKSGNQRFEDALTNLGKDDEEPNPIADATLQFFAELMTHLWVQLPVPPEFLRLSVTVELDEPAIKQALESGEDLTFAKLGEPTRWLTFSGKGKAN